MESSTHVQGWCEKQSDWWRSWKKRWFSLDKEKRVLTYADSSTTEIKASFKMQYGVFSHKPDVDQFAFSVSFKGNNVIFRTENLQNFTTWKKALTEARDGPKKVDPKQAPVVNPETPSLYPSLSSSHRRSISESGRKLLSMGIEDTVDNSDIEYQNAVFCEVRCNRLQQSGATAAGQLYAEELDSVLDTADVMTKSCHYDLSYEREVLKKLKKT